MLVSVIYWLLISRRDCIPVLYNLLAATFEYEILTWLMEHTPVQPLEGALTSTMATAAKTSLLKSGFVNWFLDPKIKPFFPKQQFFFQTQGYQNRWPIETLKKQEQSFSHDSNLGTKTKTNFILSPFTRLLPGLKNCWANFKTFSRIQDSVQTLKMNLHFFKLWCIYFFWWECRMWVNFPGVDFLEMVLRKKKIVVAYLFPP